MLGDRLFCRGPNIREQNMITPLRSAALLVALFAAGCGGGLDEPTIACTVFPDGSTATDGTMAGCNGCIVVNPQGAVDGDYDTYASVGLGDGVLAGNASVTAHAPAGARFPAGSQPGALIAAFGDTTNVTFTLTTSLGGTEQESLTVGGGESGKPLSGDRQIYSFTATQPFDTVRVQAQRPGGGGSSGFRSALYEICSTSN